MLMTTELKYRKDWRKVLVARLVEAPTLSAESTDVEEDVFDKLHIELGQRIADYTDEVNLVRKHPIDSSKDDNSFFFHVYGKENEMCYENFRHDYLMYFLYQHKIRGTVSEYSKLEERLCECCRTVGCDRSKLLDGFIRIFKYEANLLGVRWRGSIELWLAKRPFNYRGVKTYRKQSEELSVMRERATWFDTKEGQQWLERQTIQEEIVIEALGEFAISKSKTKKDKDISLYYKNSLKRLQEQFVAFKKSLSPTAKKEV